MTDITPQGLKDYGFTQVGRGTMNQHWRIFVREHSLWVKLNTRKQKAEVYLYGLNERGDGQPSDWFHLTFPNVRGIQDIYDLERMLCYKAPEGP